MAAVVARKLKIYLSADQSDLHEHRIPKSFGLSKAPDCQSAQMFG